MTKITVPFSVEGLSDAIKQIEAYKLRLRQKTVRLGQLIAERVAWSASQGFSGAIAGDVVGGERPSPDVTVEIEDNGNTQIVIASGSDAVFVEFGAGVYYNGAAGTSPHPKGNEFGFLIGEYGKGQGAKRAWGYYEDGEVKITHGTPAAMPMYHGLQDAIRVMYDLAREVFSE